ncbi:hypothetical protein RJ639_043733 [Escallonia herrerae]|uniref:HTH myb-type domain-containing protein n=1 Tax=Escallonia herrerae TaxID=1293975 RepID=A0AA89B907_9ASTE|nr:hypothetical protein RJ639_043733 [Escallonia herrerae]
MGLNPSELSLDFKPTYVPKTISQFLGEVSKIGSVSERSLKLDDFVRRLEDEMRKIDAFKRELPLCMLLIKDAIVAMKEESMQCRKLNVKPILEEFMPLKKSSDEDGKDEVRKEDSKDKMNWLSSVQLWKTDDHPITDLNNYNQKQDSVVRMKKRAEEENLSVTDTLYQPCKNRTAGRAFMPFKGYTAHPLVATTKGYKEELPVAELSLITPGIKDPPRDELGSSSLSSKSSSSRAVSSSGPHVQSNLRTGPQPQQQQSSRKQRRCWSPELHRRFVNALQQLGGSQAATPKQIRELMQVDGLTNDEVKSHLQKFRLHNRRVPVTTATSANQSVVMLGGLWMQDQCGESSKQSNSQSGSPQGPLQLTVTTGGTSTTGGDSMEDEDEKSESYSWKSHIQTSGKDDV